MHFSPPSPWSCALPPPPALPRDGRLCPQPLGTPFVADTTSRSLTAVGGALPAGRQAAPLLLLHCPGKVSAPHPVPVRPQDALTEISEWLEKHPREVVILACRNFEGLSVDLHEYLVACVKNIFGHMLCPRGVRRRTGRVVGSDGGRLSPARLRLPRSPDAKPGREPGRCGDDPSQLAPPLPAGDPDAAAAVDARPAGPGVLRGRGLRGPAPRAVAWHPLLVGQQGQDGGPHPLPGDHEELRPPRWGAGGGRPDEGPPRGRPESSARLPWAWGVLPAGRGGSWGTACSCMCAHACLSTCVHTRLPV